MTEVGSMEIVGVYKDGGLHAGIKSAMDDLKGTKTQSKGLTQEMTRMNAATVATGVAVAQLGLAFLKTILDAASSSPYMIGAMTRMRTDVQLLWWQLTKFLKPAFDLLADAIHALRMGDWDFFKEKLSEAWDFAITLFRNTWNWIKDNSPEWLVNIMVWMENTYDAVKIGMGKVWDFLQTIDWEGGENGPWEKFKEATVIAFTWIVENLLPPWLSDFIIGIGTWIDSNSALMEETWLRLTKDIPWTAMGGSAAGQFWEGFANFITSAISTLGSSIREYFRGGLGMLGDEYTSPDYGGTTYPSAATGLYVPSDGLYHLHAGESVTPANSSQGNTSNESSIILDFSGANISLASGIDLDKFADTISKRIADSQAWGSY